jgi:hypothetical protein
MEDMNLFNYYTLDECIDRKKVLSVLKELRSDGKIEFSLDGEIFKLKDIDLGEDEVEDLEQLFDDNDVFPYLEREDDEDENDDYYDDFAKNENRTFYIVCQSDKLEAVRKRYDLPEHDFHITLGFKFKDVFGVRKNEVMKKEGKFLKLLSQEFYKNNNWNFIKRIGNFDLDPNAEIIPVEITETTIKFKCDGYFVSIGYMEDGEKFWMLTKSTIDEDMPRLSETEIAKTLNKK